MAAPAVAEESISCGVMPVPQPVSEWATQAIYAAVGLDALTIDAMEASRWPEQLERSELPARAEQAVQNAASFSNRAKMLAARLRALPPPPQGCSADWNRQAGAAVQGAARDALMRAINHAFVATVWVKAHDAGAHLSDEGLKALTDSQENQEAACTMAMIARGENELFQQVGTVLPPSHRGRLIEGIAASYAAALNELLLADQGKRQIDVRLLATAHRQSDEALQALKTSLPAGLKELDNAGQGDRARDLDRSWLGSQWFVDLDQAVALMDKGSQLDPNDHVAGGALAKSAIEKGLNLHFKTGLKWAEAQHCTGI